MTDRLSYDHLRLGLEERSRREGSERSPTFREKSRSAYFIGLDQASKSRTVSLVDTK